MAKKNKGMSLDGLRCLNCGKGRYYIAVGTNKTAPTSCCGDVQPSRMTVVDFNSAVVKRNNAHG